ncbi:MAG: universal stress protein [Dehalococcoidia bacterium]
MYRKILVPLDGSLESEQVLPLVEELITPGGERILLHVIPPCKTKVLGEHIWLACQQAEAEHTWAMNYLRRVGFFSQTCEITGPWRFEAIVSSSVVKGITDFAIQEEVDLIAMYTHDRKGLAKLIRGSIAVQVQRKAPIEVRVFRPRELVSTGGGALAKDKD